MKKKILLFLTIIASIATFTVSCNDDDNTTTADSAIGSWKLVEAQRNGVALTLTSCQLLETYIIGQDGQFSHELFGSQSSGRTSLSAKNNGGSNVTQGDDDDDDGGDDGDDDGDDDGEDDGSDDGGDDSDDDGGTGGGGSTTCVSQSLAIGYWAHESGNAYTFTINNIPDTKNITFIENNTKFYYEVVTVVGGVSTTTRYVFQRQ